MAKQLLYTVFQTNQGWMGILASKAGILAATLPQTARQKPLIYWANRQNRQLSHRTRSAA